MVLLLFFLRVPPMQCFFFQVLFVWVNVAFPRDSRVLCPLDTVNPRELRLYLSVWQGK